VLCLKRIKRDGDECPGPVRRPAASALATEYEPTRPKQTSLPDCGVELKHLGEDVSEMLEIEPIRF